ncbi:MAG: hypothetical protein FJ126_09115 [Deltaproteobacteria bacterium]|nr:hypothetical protein [Deltaproteobacteria bacterium]
MRSRLVFSMLAILMCLAFCQTGAEATIFRMRFQVYTLNLYVPSGSPPSQFLQVNVTIGDSLQRPYDAVKSLKVYAPAADGTVFDLTNNWMESGQVYYARLKPSDFKTGKIPGGTYKAVVIGKDNSTLTQYQSISGAFLGYSAVTSPLAGSTVANLTPLIQWNPVTGAQYYSINLWLVTAAGEYNSAGYTVYRNSFQVPPGVLRPGADVHVSVNAYDSDKNLTKGSTSASLNFKTP